ncbi:hypothetical protein GCM10011539_03700 [Finegoldia magna]
MLQKKALSYFSKIMLPLIHVISGSGIDIAIISLMGNSLSHYTKRINPTL